MPTKPKKKPAAKRRAAPKRRSVDSVKSRSGLGTGSTTTGPGGYPGQVLNPTPARHGGGSATRGASRTPKPTKPKFNLALTDRMKAQGVSDRVRDTRVLCTVCSRSTMLASGGTRWCPSCDFA